jgi:predicted TIM-barrel fold metal-dependent hydrolase
MSVIDTYGYVSLPRFLSAEEFLRVMDENGVELAAVTAAEACLDLSELSRAVQRHGDRMRVIGAPVGETPEEMRDSVAAQMDAGFAGIRLPEATISANPEVMEPVGRAGGAAYVVGSEGLRAVAESLCEFLDRYPDSLVCAPHLAGAASPELFAHDLRIRWLFRHPRFLVILSPQAGADAGGLRSWVEALLSHTGWDRVLWGSEYPAALWRDETYASTASWIDSLGIPVTDEQRRALLYGNARRLLFGRPARKSRPLDEKWGRKAACLPEPVRLTSTLSLDLPEATHRRLFLAYQEWGGEKRGRYSEFLTCRLLESIDRQEPELPALPPSPARPAKRRANRVAAPEPVNAN